MGVEKGSVTNNFLELFKFKNKISASHGRPKRASQAEGGPP